MIFTIGYSTKSIEEFINKIKENGISLVVDVRSHPYSRWNPKFCRHSLEAELNKESVGYMFKGDNLGGLDENKNYWEAINEVIELSLSQSLVVMCTEGDPIKCHRYLTLTPELEKLGCKVCHLLWK